MSQPWSSRGPDHPAAPLVAQTLHLIGLLHIDGDLREGLLLEEAHLPDHMHEVMQELPYLRYQYLCQVWVWFILSLYRHHHHYNNRRALNRSSYEPSPLLWSQVGTVIEMGSVVPAVEPVTGAQVTEAVAEVLAAEVLIPRVHALIPQVQTLIPKALRS